MSALTEGQRLGPYRIVRLLGEGGMGAVYEARQEPLDRRVALKTLHPEYARHKDAVSRFFNEAKILSKLEHPSIVQASDFGTAEDGTAYLVMEYLRGQSLGRRLRELNASGNKLPVVAALQFAFQVADVLAVAHSQGIVHRDIKPDNLMLVADAVAPGGERVKLLDFGIAKLTHDGDRGGVRTATQAVMGTPSYMSPEQCAGAGRVDDKTDVYALGCVLYEVLTGRPPFVAEGAGQIVGMHLFQEPPPLLTLAPKVSPAIAEFVHRLLTKDKLVRPPMSQTADDLGRLLARQTGGDAPARSLATPDPDATKTVPLGPPATTLGRATGQSQLGQAGGPARKVLLLGGVISAVLGGGWVALRMRAPAPRVIPVGALPARTQIAASDPTTASSVTPPPSVSRTVTWHIDSNPTGAAVVDESGRVLGRTPFQDHRLARPGFSNLRIRRLGHADSVVTLANDQDAEQLIALSANPLPPPARSPMKSPPPFPNSGSTPTKAKPSEERRIGFED